MKHREYGAGEDAIVVVHGGPGAPGTMAAVARRLADRWRILEPFQTARSVDAQIEELRALCAESCSRPPALVGSSWGGMLGLMAAGTHPEAFRRVVVVGCGVLDGSMADATRKNRWARLEEEERLKLAEAEGRLETAVGPEAGRWLERVGEICFDADTFDPVTRDLGTIEYQPDVNSEVWEIAQRLRASGAMLETIRAIACPVVVLHGDHDPHPYEGVKGPLEAVLADVECHLIPRCGHYPWIERHAADEFFRLLREALR